jgi:SOS-response transcriptional repressor LexA
MVSKYWENVFNRLGKLDKSQVWLASVSKVGKTVINSGIARKSSPQVDHAYAIAKAFSVTIEELLDGGKGLEYVRGLIAKEGKLWELPEKIRDIVKILENLDDSELKVVKKMLAGLSQYEVSPPIFFETRDTEPEYSPDVTIPAKREKIGNVIFLDWDVVDIPYLGQTAAGKPLYIAIEPDTPTRPFPRPLIHGDIKDHFCVTVHGTSMTEAGIIDGDLALIRSTKEPEDGTIMLVRYNDESTLKRIRIRNDLVFLCWEDHSGHEVCVDKEEDYEIQGKLINMMRKPN